MTRMIAKGKIRLLVAEDYAIIRADLVEKLNSQTDMAVVGEAATGAEIVELANATPADIILMDMEMEDIHAGTRATKAILQAGIKAGIIFLTIHETDELVYAALSAGAIDYIIKTEAPEVLFAHIRGAHAGKPSLEPRLQAVLRTEFARLRRSEENLAPFVHAIASLTYSEREILRLLLQDKTVAQMARFRSVEPITVKKQIHGILTKFGFTRTSHIVKLLRDLGLDKVFGETGGQGGPFRL